MIVMKLFQKRIGGVQQISFIYRIMHPADSKRNVFYKSL